MVTSATLKHAAAASVYIPMDRRQALAQNQALPEHTQGSALFADISGFTPLTEALAQTLGPRRGAEELARQLNHVYDALIATVHRYSGSVIGFSGDAITCWFDETYKSPQASSSSLRAVACALAMHAAMQQFSAIELPAQGTVALVVKVAIASGTARRFLVGDPNLQLIDILAGETLFRMAAAEQIAQKGQVVIDAQTAASLGNQVQIVQWHAKDESGERFAIINGLSALIEPTPWPALPPEALDETQARPWLLPAVYERLHEGLGEFLTELRPAVAIFLRFAGIDYDNDEKAGEKLSAYIKWVQSVLARYEGALLQLTIGEKGSYLYAAFGAPIAHEDDPKRAVTTAMELATPPTELDYINQIQIGISRGTMRTGAYGSTTRRTYGVLGDEVNLAARLMQHALPNGDILVSRRIQKTVAGDFIWAVLDPIHVKGKSEPVPVASLVGKKHTQPETPLYTGALIGRTTELEQLAQFIVPIFHSQFAGMVYVYGEAGMGKSRLVHELRQQISNLQSLTSLKWFTCPAEAILRQSLHPFKHFLKRYFEQYADSPVQDNKTRFGQILNSLVEKLHTLHAEQISSELERMRPMLGALVDLHWEGSLYERLEPKLRFENTLAAFQAFIKAESLKQPVILHIEDAHCLDTDSYELLKVLTRNAESYPFAVLLTGRYGDDGSCFSVNVDEDVIQQTIDIKKLSPAETMTIAARALASSQDDNAKHPLGKNLAALLVEKTDGNPLFIEQLTLDLCERGMVQLENGQWNVVSNRITEIPASINAVLIARLDRLVARVKATVQTAAVLGNEFEVLILSQMLHDDEQLPLRIKQAETEMIWSALNEIRYIFRNRLLRDAAYDMQLQSRLCELHELAGTAIEQVYAADLGPHYADLAHHFGKAGKSRQEYYYARLAGERAVEQFANQEAVEHFNHALRSAHNMAPSESIGLREEIHSALGELLTNIGQYEQAHQHLDDALALAVTRDDHNAQARICRWLAHLHEQTGEYLPALDWVKQGLATLQGQESAEAAQLLLAAGLVHTRLGDYDSALEQCQLGLRITEKLQELPTLARAYNLLGHVARLRGQSTTAIEHFQHALDLVERTGDIKGQATSHNQIANAYFNTGQWRAAEKHYCQAREMFEQIGDVYQRAFTDNNLGGIMLNQGRLDEASLFYQAALNTLEQIGGSSWVLGALHMNLGWTFTKRGEINAAYEHLRTSQDYFQQAQVRDFMPELYRHLAETALLAHNVSEAEAHGRHALLLARELAMRGEEGSSLRIRGEVAMTQGHYSQASTFLKDSITILKEANEQYELARSQLCLAQLYAAQSNKEASRVTLEECIPILEQLGAAPDLAAARNLQAKVIA